MKFLTVLLFSLSLSIADQPTKSSCNCVEAQSAQLEAFQKGNIQKYLLYKADYRLQLLKERRSILEYVLKQKSLKPAYRPKIQAQIKAFKSTEAQLVRLNQSIKKAKITGKAELFKMLHEIQDKSGAVLKRSSELLYGTYHSDEVPPVIVITPGGGISPCGQGESPPSLDCAGVAQGVNSACLDGIQQKMECGYYTDLGAEAQNQLSQDQSECTTAMENSRSACQRAVESCDQNYDPNADQQDFWRRASMDCSLKDMLNDIAETQTADGN